MKIGLIDLDSHNFPNLPLMKLSAYHKSVGDTVEWYDSMFSGHMGRVYVSKVFSFSPDYQYFINADEVLYGGSGYCIFQKDGNEAYDPAADSWLPDNIEHIYPDYSLYTNLTENTAYGFLSRGCPRKCPFCHVWKKEGKKSYKVANLKEFWHGQKNIVLMDPNITACRECEDLFDQLIESRASIDITQGLDIRLMDEKKIEKLMQMKIKNIHFAWDRYRDKERIIQKFKLVKDMTGYDKRKMSVYVLVNFETTLAEDLERIYTLRDIGYTPYVMVYDKKNLPPHHYAKNLQRWVNSKSCFYTIPNFADYRPR